jgi:hypothetical protein
VNSRKLCGNYKISECITCEGSSRESDYCPKWQSRPLGGSHTNIVLTFPPFATTLLLFYVHLSRFSRAKNISKERKGVLPKNAIQSSRTEGGMRVRALQVHHQLGSLPFPSFHVFLRSCKATHRPTQTMARSTTYAKFPLKTSFSGENAKSDAAAAGLTVRWIATIISQDRSLRLFHCCLRL